LKKGAVGRQGKHSKVDRGHRGNVVEQEKAKYQELEVMVTVKKHIKGKSARTSGRKKKKNKPVYGRVGYIGG